MRQLKLGSMSQNPKVTQKILLLLLCHMRVEISIILETEKENVELQNFSLYKKTEGEKSFTFFLTNNLLTGIRS